MYIGAQELLHWFIRQLGDEEQLLKITDLLLTSEGQLSYWVTDKGIIRADNHLHMQGGSVLCDCPWMELLLKDDAVRCDWRLSFKYLCGQVVYDEEGTPLGAVGDLTFDSKSGQLVALELSEGLLRDLFQGRRVLAGERLEAAADGVIFH